MMATATGGKRGEGSGATKERPMTHQTSMRECYRRIVRAGRHGDPTIDEARADYCRAVDAQLPARLFRI